jgi:hypothetical protein
VRNGCRVRAGVGACGAFPDARARGGNRLNGGPARDILRWSRRPPGDCRQSSKNGTRVFMTKRQLRKPTLLRRALDLVHEVQWRAGGLVKGPSAGMRTDARVGERPVLFIHNPRTAGRSLEAMLNVKRLSHRFPSEKLTERQWRAAFIVSAVRHPLDRFHSHYKKIVTSRKTNRLVKLYGEGVYELSPMEFLDLIRMHPRYGGI